jgi:hypothetical protein
MMSNISPLLAFETGVTYYWFPILVGFAAFVFAAFVPGGSSSAGVAHLKRQFSPSADYTFVPFGIWGFLAIRYMADGIRAGHAVRHYDEFIHLHEYLAAFIVYVVLLAFSITANLLLARKGLVHTQGILGTCGIALFAGGAVFSDFMIVLALYVCAA